MNMVWAGLPVLAAGVAFLVAGNASTIYARSEPAGPAIECRDARMINTTINGSDSHDAQISNVIAITTDTGRGLVRKQLVAFEYQSYGGKEYVEFLEPHMVGAYISLPKPQFYEIFRKALTGMGLSQDALQAPFSTFSAATVFSQSRCVSVPNA